MNYSITSEMGKERSVTYVHLESKCIKKVCKEESKD